MKNGDVFRFLEQKWKAYQVFLLLLLVGCNSKPTGHSLCSIHGFAVAIDDRLPADSRALSLLKAELQYITEKLPPSCVAKLQSIPIFVDQTHGALRNETYHPDLPWLIEHGYSRALWKAVQITRASDFCDPARRRIEPLPVLHQLIHGFQDRAFGFEGPAIVAGWKRFKAGRANCRVKLPSGEMGPHPALIRPREYFLEMSLAYFNIGRVPPKTAEELKKKDPKTFQLIEECWKKKFR